MTVRSHKLKLVMSPTSNSKAGSVKHRSANLLFSRAEPYIPAKILEVVRTTLFAADRRHDFPPQDFEDLTQSCLAKVWQTEAKYETESLEYFGRIVKNTVADYFRRLSRDELIHYEGDIGDLAALEGEVKEETLSCHYSKSELFDLIAALNDEEAAVVLLRVYEGFTYQQISVHLSKSISTVKRRYAIAMRKLKCKLQTRDVLLRQVEKPVKSK
jgi:RNA polymerase sigma factor (sigma-70 family)